MYGVNRIGNRFGWIRVGNLFYISILTNIFKIRLIDMPRNYVRDPRSKAYTKRTETEIKPAINAIKNGMSIKEASRRFKIPYTVLHRHYSKKDLKKPGGQTVLSEEEELVIVEKLETCAEWGYPIDKFTLRLFVKNYLERRGKTVSKFKNNLPGPEFAISFLKRHKNRLAVRMCQNIKRARAAVSRNIIMEYFENLRGEIEDIPNCNIINYDETNLSDDPGRKRIITKRGCKYPERVANFSKTATSLMFAASATGDLLPPYVVYKSTNLYDTWTTNGPPGTRYNRTKSGWFDAVCFEDWLKKILIPHFNKLKNDKPKIIIGDNLSSHLSDGVIDLCTRNNVKPIFLPPNSTHLTQPLDVALFAPLKRAWRKVLTVWKAGPGQKETTVPKDVFPRLLKKLLAEIQENLKTDILAGFRKCGIVPFNPEKVLERLPKELNEGEEENAEVIRNVTDALTELLKSMRYGDPDMHRSGRKKKIPVAAGKSVSRPDSESEDSEGADSPDSVVSESSNLSDNEDSDDSSNSDSENNEPNSSSDNVQKDEAQPSTSASHNTELQAYNLAPNDFVIVRFTTNKGTRRFVAQIKKVFETELLVSCLRKKVAKSVTFVFPNIEDECMVKNEDVERKIAPLTIKRGHHHFILDHTGLE